MEENLLLYNPKAQLFWDLNDRLATDTSYKEQKSISQFFSFSRYPSLVFIDIFLDLFLHLLVQSFYDLLMCHARLKLGNLLFVKSDKTVLRADILLRLGIQKDPFKH